MASPRTKSPTAKGTKTATKTSPTMMAIVTEALKQSEEADGLTVYGINTYIQSNYPAVAKSPSYRTRLRTALAKGLESGALKRPKRSRDSVGANGFFQLDIAKPKKAAKTEKRSRTRSASPSKGVSNTGKKRRVSSSTSPSKDAKSKGKAKPAKKVSKPRSRSNSPAEAGKAGGARKKKAAATSPKKVAGAAKKASGGKKKPTSKKSASKVTKAKSSA